MKILVVGGNSEFRVTCILYDPDKAKTYTSAEILDYVNRLDAQETSPELLATDRLRILAPPPPVRAQPSCDRCKRTLHHEAETGHVYLCSECALK